ncbi:MAG: nucleotidyltransferase family protein [Cyanobacteria bacterium P01_H01_bin.152]
MSSRIDHPLPIAIPQDQITAFCQRHHIHKLSLFGSVLRNDFTADSDVDFLVEFAPGQAPGYLGLAGMEIELSKMIGRKADLRTPQELSPYFRDDVLREAVLQYDQN